MVVDKATHLHVIVFGKKLSYWENEVDQQGKFFFLAKLDGRRCSLDQKFPYINRELNQHFLEHARNNCIHFFFVSWIGFLSFVCYECCEKRGIFSFESLIYYS